MIYTVKTQTNPNIFERHCDQ